MKIWQDTDALASEQHRLPLNECSHIATGGNLACSSRAKARNDNWATTRLAPHSHHRARLDLSCQHTACPTRYPLSWPKQSVGLALGPLLLRQRALNITVCSWPPTTSIFGSVDHGCKGV
jgi:hypothetical protein